jgi:hypothetical protein
MPTESEKPKTGMAPQLPFKALENGRRIAIDEKRTVDIFIGEAGDYVIIWTKDGVENAVRLSKEGAHATASLIFAATHRLPSTMHEEPVI